MNKLAEEINRRITIEDVLRRYGYPTNQSRRIPCPIHGGINNNFSYKGNLYHCFSCGATGNTIRLVEKLFNINFIQALNKINSDFGLSLQLKKPTCNYQVDYAEEIRIDKAIAAWKEGKRQEYLLRTEVYEKLYRAWVRGHDIPGLKEYLDELECWLDENIFMI